MVRANFATFPQASVFVSLRLANVSRLEVHSLVRGPHNLPGQNLLALKVKVGKNGVQVTDDRTIAPLPNFFTLMMSGGTGLFPSQPQEPSREQRQDLTKPPVDLRANRRTG